MEMNLLEIKNEGIFTESQAQFKAVTGISDFSASEGLVGFSGYVS